MARKISVTFLGGVVGPNLTASCLFFTIRSGKKIIKFLIDIGMWQGGGYEACLLKNQIFPIDVKDLDFIILTHAHTDHIGRLALLARMGFRGKVFCTSATADFLPIMLIDSAKIQKEENRKRLLKQKKANNKTPRKARKKSRKDYPKHEMRKARREESDFPSFISKSRIPSLDNLSILFTDHDVKESLKLVKNGGFEYKQWIHLDKDLALKFYPSGHVLGGAICVIKISPERKNEEPIYLGFSGDLGRKDGIILPPPAMISEPLNFWFTESTYGGIKHPNRAEEIDRFFTLIRKACAEKLKIIIPTFAFEKTPEMIYEITAGIVEGKIPKITICLDSPLARKLLTVFKDKWLTPLFKNQAKLPFNPYDPNENPYLEIMETEAESNALVRRSGPIIVMAASGMCDHGRIRNHLEVGLESKDVIICTIGFMAHDTLGEKIQTGYKMVRMKGRDIIVRAQVVKFDIFHAHADGPFLAEYSSKIIRAGNPAIQTFIIHGPEKGGPDLKADILETLGETSELNERIHIPLLNQTIQLTT